VHPFLCFTISNYNIFISVYISRVGTNITHINTQNIGAMAAATAHTWGKLRRMNDHELTRLVESGRERDSWLGMSSALLDIHFRHWGKISDDESAQHPFSSGLAPLHEWTDHITHDPSDSTLEPILVALASLAVGDEVSVMPWQTRRDVNTLNQPHGYNIHLKMVQDKQYRSKYPVSVRT
jgi:hypothetical protein